MLNLLFDVLLFLFLISPLLLIILTSHIRINQRSKRYRQQEKDVLFEDVRFKNVKYIYNPYFPKDKDN